MGVMKEMMKDLTVGGFSSLGEKILGRKSDASMTENIVKGAAIRGAVSMLRDTPEKDSYTYEQPRTRYVPKDTPEDPEPEISDSEKTEHFQEEDDPDVKLMYQALSGKDIWNQHADSDKSSELQAFNQMDEDKSDTYDYSISDYDKAKKLYEIYYKENKV